jgi:hypothetical protein
MTHSDSDLDVIHLGRQDAPASNAVAVSGVAPPRSRETWTDVETKFLLEHALQMSYSRIARLLNKTRESVCAKANRLKVKKAEKMTPELRRMMRGPTAPRKFEVRRETKRLKAPRRATYGQASLIQAVFAESGAQTSPAAPLVHVAPELLPSIAAAHQDDAPHGFERQTRIDPQDGISVERICRVDPRDAPIKGKALVDLENNECRWPIGDPLSSTFVCCGEPKVTGLPYCKPHTLRAFQPSQGRRSMRTAGTPTRLPSLDPVA